MKKIWTVVLVIVIAVVIANFTTGTIAENRQETSRFDVYYGENASGYFTTCKGLNEVITVEGKKLYVQVWDNDRMDICKNYRWHWSIGMPGYWTSSSDPSSFDCTQGYHSSDYDVLIVEVWNGHFYEQVANQIVVFGDVKGDFMPSNAEVFFAALGDGRIGIDVAFDYQLTLVEGGGEERMRLDLPCGKTTISQVKPGDQLIVVARKANGEESYPMKYQVTMSDFEFME